MNYISCTVECLVILTDCNNITRCETEIQGAHWALSTTDYCVLLSPPGWSWQQLSSCEAARPPVCQYQRLPPPSQHPARQLRTDQI